MISCSEFDKLTTEAHGDAAPRFVSLDRIDCDQPLIAPTSALSAVQLLALVGAGVACWAIIALGISLI
ncbi:MAG: hypothetical protein JWL66_2213 [Sphingomonadales bacterium]|nr:hypothetical protein [Sphingomonadales bacterium]